MSTKQERTLRRANSLLASQFLEWTIVSATDRLKRVCFSLTVLLLTFILPLIDFNPLLQLVFTSVWKLSGNIQIFYIRIFTLVCLGIDTMYYLSKFCIKFYEFRAKDNTKERRSSELEKPLTEQDDSNEKLEQMSGPDGFWAVNDEQQPIIMAVVKLEGHPDVKAIQKEFSERILSKRRDDGSLKYKKLKMAKAIIDGKLYWKLEDNFSINQHVYQLQNQNIQIESEETILHQIEPLLEKNFKPNFSPWDIIVITDDKLKSLKCYYLIVRLHHSIADGISMVMLLLGDLAEGLQNEKTSTSKTPQISSPNRAFAAVKAVVELPAVIYKNYLFKDSNCLHGPLLTGEKMAEVSEAMDVKMIKDIKNKSHTSVSSVLMSCLCGSLYRYFEDHPEATPNTIKGGFPLLLNVPDQDSPLGNYFTVGFADFSMREMHPVQRLQTTFQSMQDMKASSAVAINAATMKYLTLVLPHTTAKKITMECQTTLTVTNVPGPTSPISLWGDKVTDMYFLAPNVGNSGLTVSILSYVDRMRIGLRADTTVIPTHAHLRKIQEGFMQELELLKAAVKA